MSHGDAALTTLGRIYNDEGYIENPTSPQYYYYRRDHLSDNREVWLANTNTVVQRTSAAARLAQRIVWPNHTVEQK